MTDTDYLLVRIVPTQPVGPTAFRAALNDITITAWDKMVLDPTTDRKLGSATGLSDQPTPGQPTPGGGTPDPIIPLLVISGSPPTLTPSIFQHFGLNTSQNSIVLYSVATAVIIINQAALQDPNEEYPTSKSYDVTLTIGQSSNQQTAVDRQQTVDFNVEITSEQLTTDPTQYMSASTAVYLSIDVPVSPLPAGTNIVSLNTDGTPPTFDFMVKSINNVLAVDSPAGASSLQTMTTYLSTKQAQEVANELVNNRLVDPPPAAPYSTSVVFNTGTVFEDMYTIPDTGGQVKQDIDQARTKFEGDRSSYYALRASDAIQFANFVFSTIFAVYAESYAATAPRAVVDVSIQRNIQHEASVSTPSLPLAGANGGALDPPFTVPAAYFYALTTTYAISQSFDTRLKLLFTTPQDALSNSLKLAIESGVLGTPSPTDKLIHYASTLNSSNNVNINQLQAIRRIVALSASVQNAPQASAVPAANTSLQSLIQAWLDFEGVDDDVPAKVWFPTAAEYLNAVLEIIAPGAEPLISKILDDLRLPSTSSTQLGPVIQTVNDLLGVTEKEWLEFFTRHPDMLPKAYLLGSLKDRVHMFVQGITKVLFVLPTPQTDDGTPTQSSIPSFGGDLNNDVLVQFFDSYSFSLSGTLGATELEQIHAQALQMFDSEDIASFVTSAAKELWVLFQVTSLSGNI